MQFTYIYSKSTCSKDIVSYFTRYIWYTWMYIYIYIYTHILWLDAQLVCDYLYMPMTSICLSPNPHIIFLTSNCTLGTWHNQDFLNWLLLTPNFCQLSSPVTWLNWRCAWKHPLACAKQVLVKYNHVFTSVCFLKVSYVESHAMWCL